MTRVFKLVQMSIARMVIDKDYMPLKMNNFIKIIMLIAKNKI